LGDAKLGATAEPGLTGVDAPERSCFGVDGPEPEHGFFGVDEPNVGVRLSARGTFGEPSLGVRDIRRRSAADVFGVRDAGLSATAGLFSIAGLW
jgi:hypothetical protein